MNKSNKELQKEVQYYKDMVEYIFSFTSDQFPNKIVFDGVIVEALCKIRNIPYEMAKEDMPTIKTN